MGVTEIVELVGIFLLAGSKFAVAVGLLVSPATEFSYLQSVAMLISGGFTGILFFYYFSSWINKMIAKIFQKKKKKQLFSKKVRRFINIKNKYGLIGIALITPVIISIPVGSFIASRFFSKNKLTLLFMLAGVVFWSVTLPLIKLTY
jgi:membrane protein DedA with SNARE-associated domain